MEVKTMNAKQWTELGRLNLYTVDARLARFLSTRSLDGACFRDEYIEDALRRTLPPDAFTAYTEAEKRVSLNCASSELWQSLRKLIRITIDDSVKKTVMAAPSQKVLNWLHNVLTSEYRNVNRTYSDIAQTLSYNPWISLRTDVYTFERGESSLLLNLHGSIPVSFRGTTYAFPISIWVPREYPLVAPINFVIPTKDMAIRPGQHVSGEGRIYHPYLADWRDDRSNIAEVVSLLQGIFAREPPVVARQEQTPRPTPMSQRNGVPPPVPPLPPELGRSYDRGTKSPSSAVPKVPAPPPKPFESRRQNTAQFDGGPPPLPPHPTRSNSQYGYLQQGQQDAYTRAPQSRVQEPARGAQSTWDNPSAAQWHHNGPHERIPQPQGEPISPLSPQTPIGPGRSFSTNSGYPPQARYSQSGSALPPQPYPQSDKRDLSHPPAQTPVYQQQHSHAYTHQHPLHHQPQQPAKPKPPEDLLTSPFEATLPVQPANVAPPPIPPNPQKDALLSALSQNLGEQVRSIHASNASAIAPLRAQQAALTSTLNNVNMEISQLNELEKLLTSNEAILHQAMRDADEVLEDAKKREVPNVDEVLFAPTVVARQLYEAVADERAIEDCRTVLAKGLDKGRVGGGVWAKQTRSLAREEFLKKALIKKIAQGMGLVEEDRWS